MSELEMAKRKLEIIQFILDCNDEAVLLECELILKELLNKPHKTQPSFLRKVKTPCLLFCSARHPFCGFYVTFFVADPHAAHCLFCSKLPIDKERYHKKAKSRCPLPGQKIRHKNRPKLYLHNG